MDLDIWKRAARALGFTALLVMIQAQSMFSRQIFDRDDFITKSYVPKRHESMEARIVFAAGLEGTGHHILQMMFNACIKYPKKKIAEQKMKNITGTEILIGCEVSDMTHFMFWNKYHNGIFFASDEVNLGHNLQELKQSMQRMVQLKKSPHLYILGLEISRESGMMSYPNFNYADKVLDHPDSFVLASMAESAGLDLRLIVLQRDANEIMHSTFRRRFGTLNEPEILILIDNASVLFTELSLIDKRFYYCIEFSRLVSENWAAISDSRKSHIMRFLHPSIVTEEVLKQMVQAINGTSTDGASTSASKSSKLTPVQFTSSDHYEAHNFDVRMRLIEQKCQSRKLREDLEEHDQSLYQNKFMLEKTVFNRTRLVIVAGLMGSGLRAVHDIMDVCFKEAKVANSCKAETDLSESLFKKSGRNNSTVYSGFFVGRDIKSRTAILSKIQERLHKIASKPGDNMFVLGLGFNNAGMMSYPNFDAEESLNHPDVYSLATMAEAMNVDFRVVVLTREPRDILATLQRRNLTRSYRKILTDNAAALFTQLYMLDRKFFTCIDYGSLGSLSGSQQDALASFLQPAVLSKDLLHRMLASVHKKTERSIPEPSKLRNTTFTAGVSLSELLKRQEVADDFHLTQLTARMQLIQALCAQQ